MLTIRKSRNRMFNERQEVQAPGFRLENWDETGKPLEERFRILLLEAYISFEDIPETVCRGSPVLTVKVRDLLNGSSWREQLSLISLFKANVHHLRAQSDTKGDVHIQTPQWAVGCRVGQFLIRPHIPTPMTIIECKGGRFMVVGINLYGNHRPIPQKFNSSPSKHMVGLYFPSVF